MPTRREFIATTTLAAIASGSSLHLSSTASPAPSRGAGFQPASPAPATSPSPPTSNPRNLHKAAMIGMVAEGDTIKEKFAMLREAGFEGVEMDSPTSLKSDDILKARDATGIKIHGVVDSVHWKYQLNNPEPAVRVKGQEALQQAIRDAAAWGASSVLLVPAVVNKDMPYDAAYTLSQAEIRKALPLAEELKVRIAIENVWNNFLLSPLEAARYVDDFKSPWVCWHLDLGNIIHYAWPEQWARVLGSRVHKLHIKEFSRKKSIDEGLWKGFEVELGEGDNGWPATMKALDEIGYSTGDHWATAEVGGGGLDRLKDIAARMDKILAT